MFEGTAGVRNNLFTLDEVENRARNVYVWESAVAGRQFFSDQLL